MIARDEAQQDAELYGVGFMVDGLRVHPGRVIVVRAAQPVAGELPPLPELPTHAVLYTQNGYRRAATTPHAGDPLVLKQEALNAMRVYGSQCRAAQPVQQPAAVAGQEPIGYAPTYLTERIAAGDAAVMLTVTRKPLPGHGVTVALYTAPVPAAGVQGDAMCPVCKGSGEQRGPHGFPCVTCDGTGEVLDLPAVKSSDISHCLREYARNSGYSHNDYADAMRIAADEIDRLTAVQQQPDSGRDAALVALLREAMEVINSVPSTYGIDLVSRINAALVAHPANGAQAGELSDEDVLALWEVVRDEGGYSSMMFVTDAGISAYARAILAAAKKGP